MTLSNVQCVGHWGGVGQVDVVKFVLSRWEQRKNRLVEGWIEKER